MIELILLVLGFVLALIEALWPSLQPPHARPHLGWLALAVFLLSLILRGGGLAR